MSEKRETNKQKAKCKYCEDSIPKGEGVKHSGRYYHPNCFEEWRGQADDRTQLIDYVLQTYGIRKPTGMMLMQIKRFHEEFEYTYKGMELTLRYFYEILDNKVDGNTGLGIIPYLYEEATEQYIRQMKINESARDEDNHKIEERIVYVSPQQTDKLNKNKKRIDISEL